MLFNSTEYFLFFGVVAVLHFAIPHRFRWLLLLVASYAFYMSWNATYILLILASTVVDFFIGPALAREESPRRRKALLFTSLGANLGLLFVFKYWNFANDSLRALAERFGLGWQIPDLDVLLPVGISFYTFQTLSYTIDIYRRRLKAEHHPGHFALYVAFFPQLVAGPIERASSLLPQIDRIKRVDWDRIFSGVQLVMWGLFKKVVIADRVAAYVEAVFGNVEFHNATSVLLATYLFAFQLYCDFSGYSDMAIGSAKILGFDLMENFRRPYFSTTTGEFWRRWHISLSTWLRDYLYLGLGNPKRTVSRTYINLFLTMLLGGLWHGASWNFVIWGAFWGSLLALSRATIQWRDRLYRGVGVPNRVRDLWRMFVVFHLGCISWVFFRAETLDDSMHMYRTLFGSIDNWQMPFIHPLALVSGGLGIALLLLVQVWQERVGSVRASLARGPLVLQWGALYALMFWILLLGVEGGDQFIYFQF
ncbi:MAG: MBOAT family O-acyltransferase [Myxococcota bacterium]